VAAVKATVGGSKHTRKKQPPDQKDHWSSKGGYLDW